MGFRMDADFLQDFREAGCGNPVPSCLRKARIQDGPRDVKGSTGLVIGGEMGIVRWTRRADFLSAPSGEFAQGHRVLMSTREVDGAGHIGATKIDLLEEKRDDVARMKAVAHLQAGTAEADVFQRTLGAPRMNPKGENTLVGLAKLTRPGKDAAAIDPNRESEGVAVFQRQRLGA